MKCLYIIYTCTVYFIYAHSLYTKLVLPHGLQQTQNVEKKVEKVQIEVDGGHDVLLSGHLVHDHVCVKYDEATEDQRSPNSQHKLQSLTPKEYLHMV